MGTAWSNDQGYTSKCEVVRDYSIEFNNVCECRSRAAARNNYHPKTDAHGNASYVTSTSRGYRSTDDPPAMAMRQTPIGIPMRESKNKKNKGLGRILMGTKSTKSSNPFMKSTVRTGSLATKASSTRR